MSLTGLQPLYDAILHGRLEAAREEAQAALQAGVAPDRILREGLIEAMTETGRLFEAGEFYVPEMLVAARAMKGCLALLRPALVASDVQPAGRIVIGTVSGDLHDIGKNLVSMMLEGAGFEVLDLGVDVPPQRFLEAVQQDRPDILAMSALLTTTMAQMAKTVDALAAAGIRGKAKVIVGGAPVTEGFAAKIGADGYAPDASRAATLAKHLITSRG
ncbi:MAG: methyltransferase [Chloroflexi bacterium RBG_13_66_10]|nr:MAG: methyltransferase [Chloroflexi bacterium RBG_13_66_10]